MSDLNHHDEEEYHFDDSESFDFGEHAAEEEFVGDEEVVENTKTKDWSNVRSTDAASTKKPMDTKKILMGVGVAVLLIAGYYLMMPRGKAPATTSIPAVTEPKANAQAKPAATPAVATPASNNDGTMTQQDATAAEQNAATASNANTALDSAANGDWLNNDNSTPSATNDTQATTSATAAASDVPNDNSLAMQVQTLNQENQALTLKLQAVTAQSEATSARANNLGKVVAQMQTQLKQMTQTSPPPLQRPKSVAAEPTTTPRASTATRESKTALVYYVQAIIPGRAWIGDSNGRIITVTQGDRVEVLNSTVRNIDPINGIVTLSNGMQIEYGMVAQ